MSTFVLIHGSWHGAWCWTFTSEILQSTGHSVLCPDLLGHGPDQTAIEQIEFNDYVDSVCALLNPLNEPCILVGHSFAGAVITAVASRLPERVSSLVYISAFLPSNGQSTTEQAGLGSGSVLAGRISISADHLRQELPLTLASEAFYHDCPTERRAWALEKLGQEPYRPNIEPVFYNTECLARIHKTYIECLADRALPLSLQRLIQQPWRWRHVYSLNCGHSPMLSCPEQLALILLNEIATVAHN